jgi:hypothetical protein
VKDRISRRRFGLTASLLLDLLRPGATSVGWVLPLLVGLIVLAIAAALIGQVVLPWTIYPAL